SALLTVGRCLASTLSKSVFEIGGGRIYLCAQNKHDMPKIARQTREQNDSQIVHLVCKTFGSELLQCGLNGSWMSWPTRQPHAIGSLVEMHGILSFPNWFKKHVLDLFGTKHANIMEDSDPCKD
ncbi:hypothetical protein BHE74_00018201, partial [Ensete ventricosum]